MAPLVQAGCAEQVGGRACGSDGGLGPPRNGWGVIGEGGHCAFPYVPVMGKSASMGNNPWQFEVRVSDGARQVGCCDQLPLDLWWERSLPYVWWVLWIVRVLGGEPDPAHASEGCVTTTGI